MTTTYTTSLRLIEPQPGDPAVRNSWGPLLNENMVLVEAAILDTASVSIAGLTTYTLTVANGAPDQARPFIQFYTGALTGTCTVTLPNVPKIGWAVNGTTGGHSVVLTTGVGSTLTLPPDSTYRWFLVDGSGNVIAPSQGFAAVSIGSVSSVLTLEGGVLAPGSQEIAFGTFNKLNVSQAILSVENDSGIAAQFMNNSAAGGSTIVLRSDQTSPQTYFATFNNSGSTIGSIGNGGSSVSFNSTSDARLKIDDGRISAEDSGRIIDRLLPKWFRWETAPEADAEPGFFAQQMARIFPWGVTRGRGGPGSKNFVPWQTDNSKLVPLLVAELQWLRKRVAALEKAR